VELHESSQGQWENRSAGTLELFRELLRASLEAGGVAAAICTADGRVQAITAQAETLLGSPGRVDSEGQILAALAARAREHRTAESLRAEANANEGVVRVPLLEEDAIQLERHDLPGGLTMWLLTRVTGPEAQARRSEILSIASHDLRSPLANVKSYAGMIVGGRGPPLEPRIQRAAQVISKNADRGLKLVDDLVDLRKAEEHRLQLDRAQVLVNEPLRLAFEEARAAATDKGVNLIWSAGDALPTMNLDEDRFRRMVRALLEAGIRRTPPGGDVRLVAEVRDPELYLAVEDEGERPSLREVALAFDRDHQILQNRKLLPGVSLLLAQHVARAHGGKVGFVPRPGTGAIYYLVLPR
jgi:two-component system OmpR family sensor kinase